MTQMPQKPGTFSFQMTEKRGAVIISMEGYFTETSTDTIENALAPSLKQGKTRIVMDFARISLMNSPGIASLLELLLKIREESLGKCVLCGITPLLREIFQMAGVTPMFPVAGDILDAIDFTQME